MGIDREEFAETYRVTMMRKLRLQGELLKFESNNSMNLYRI